MCGALISLIAQISGLVHGMQRDEDAVKASNSLATSIREQYMHQAHWLIEGDSHLDHYQELVVEIADETKALAPLVPPSEAERLVGVTRASVELDRLFREELIPAHRAGNQRAVLAAHHRLEAITAGATADADAIARAVEGRMAKAHRSATRYTRLGLIAGGVCVALVLALSAFFTVRLGRAVLRPLGQLVQAANRFGAGDFESTLR